MEDIPSFLKIVFVLIISPLLLKSKKCTSHFCRESENENKQFKETKKWISNWRANISVTTSVFQQNTANYVLLKCRRKLGKSKNPGEKQGFFLNGSPLIPSLPTYSKFQLLFITLNIWNWLISGRMLLDPSLRPLGGTKIWTQNSKYRMKDLKATISETFFPPGPLKQTLIFKSLHLCNPMLYTLDISCYEFYYIE